MNKGLFLLPNETLNELAKIKVFTQKPSVDSMTMALHNAWLLVEPDDGRHLVQQRVNGSRVRGWLLRPGWDEDGSTLSPSGGDSETNTCGSRVSDVSGVSGKKQRNVFECDSDEPSLPRENTKYAGDNGDSGDSKHNNGTTDTGFSSNSSVSSSVSTRDGNGDKPDDQVPTTEIDKQLRLAHERQQAKEEHFNKVAEKLTKPLPRENTKYAGDNGDSGDSKHNNGTTDTGFSSNSSVSSSVSTRDGNGDKPDDQVPTTEIDKQLRLAHERQQAKEEHFNKVAEKLTKPLPRENTKYAGDNGDSGDSKHNNGTTDTGFSSNSSVSSSVSTRDGNGDKPDDQVPTTEIDKQLRLAHERQQAKEEHFNKVAEKLTKPRKAEIQEPGDLNERLRQAIIRDSGMRSDGKIDPDPIAAEIGVSVDFVCNELLRRGYQEVKENGSIYYKKPPSGAKA